MVRWLPSRSTLHALIAPMLGVAVALSITARVASGDCPDPPVIIQQPLSWVRGWDQPVTFSFQFLSSASPPIQSGQITWLKDGSPFPFGSPDMTTSGDTVTASFQIQMPESDQAGVYQARIIQYCQTGPDTFVTDTCRLTVRPLDPSPPLAVVWAPSTEVTSPAALTLDDSENVFVARKDAAEIQEFDRNGRLLRSWALSGTLQSGSGITFDNQGNLLVVVGPKVQKYTPTGQFLGEFTAGNSENGRTHDPWSIAVDRLNFIYIGDQNSGHIQRFDSQGNFVNAWGKQGSSLLVPGEFITVSGILVDSLLRVYVVDQGHSWVQIFDTSGNVLNVWNTPGQANGQFVWPSSIGQDRFGRIFITDKYNANIQAFDSSQTLLMKWQFGNTGGPMGVGVGRRGSIFAIHDEFLNNNLYRWGDCDPPTVIADPKPVLIRPGANAQFTVDALGTPSYPTGGNNLFSYQWRRNGVALPYDNHVQGATDVTLHVYSITPADSGLYDVIVSNNCGADTSAAAALVPCLTPGITAQPVAVDVALGQTATFVVAASPATGYRWFRGAAALSDGGRITGALTDSLTIAAVQAADSGAYHVEVYGLCDTLASSVATLTITAVAGCDPSAHANPPPTMAAWWAMDPGVGNSVPDVFHPNSSKHHASLTGAATLVPGMVGTAVRCPGPNDGLHVPSTLSPDLANASTGLSIDAWIYPRSGSSNAAYRMILDKGLLAHKSVNVNGSDALAPGYAFYVWNGGQLGFQMPDASYNPVRFEPAMTRMSMDAWHHVAVTATPAPSGGALYLDGVRVATFTPSSGIFGNLADLYIGRFTPQLGPAVPDSAFNGDIDEVEVFTSAIDSSDVRKIWAASCAGKRREMALLPATIQIRQKTSQADACGSIANFTAAPATYTWSLEVLPSGPGCPNSVPVTFTPSSGTVSAAAGDYATVSSTASVDASYLSAPFTVCYRLTATNQSGGPSFSADGTLTYFDSKTSGAGHCSPPQIGAPASSAASFFPDGISGAGSFTVINDADNQITLNYQITTRNPDTGGPSSLLSLDGLPPGTPVTGSVTVDANSQAEVPVGVGLDQSEPLLRDEILLNADVSGDGLQETVASTIVRSAEDTSLAFVGVPPAGAGLTASLTVSPNPFRGSAHVLLVLPTTGQVDVTVFDVVGRRVRQLHGGLLTAGRHDLSWDGTDDGGRRRPPGLYFVRVRGVTSGSLTKKFVQMR